MGVAIGCERRWPPLGRPRYARPPEIPMTYLPLAERKPGSARNSQQPARAIHQLTQRPAPPPALPPYTLARATLGSSPLRCLWRDCLIIRNRRTVDGSYCSGGNLSTLAETAIASQPRRSADAGSFGTVVGGGRAAIAAEMSVRRLEAPAQRPGYPRAPELWHAPPADRRARRRAWSSFIESSRTSFSPACGMGRVLATQGVSVPGLTSP